MSQNHHNSYIYIFERFGKFLLLIQNINYLPGQACKCMLNSLRILHLENYCQK
jgi:hypothetical protein